MVDMVVSTKCIVIDICIYIYTYFYFVKDYRDTLKCMHI